MNKWKKEGQLK